MLLLEGDEEEIVDVPSMTPLEDDEEEVKAGERLKILTANKLSTRLISVFSLNKNWKQFLQTKKRNQTNTISFVSKQENHARF